MLTLANLLCGVLAIKLFFDHNINGALLLVVAGTIFYFFDGAAKYNEAAEIKQ